jgi:hypothetical protein
MCKETSARKECFKRRIQQREQGGEEDGKEFWTDSIFWKVYLLQIFYKRVVFGCFLDNIYFIAYFIGDW